MLTVLLIAGGGLTLLCAVAAPRPRTTRPYEKNGWKHRSDLEGPAYRD